MSFQNQSNPPSEPDGRSAGRVGDAGNSIGNAGNSVGNAGNSVGNAGKCVGTTSNGRRRFLRTLLLTAATSTVVNANLVGCSSFSREKATAPGEELKSLLTVPKPPETVGLATGPIGLQPLMISGVGAINSLPSTGGAPDPSQARDELIMEMKRHDIKSCEAFLEETSTALVEVQALIPAGARRGDSLDVAVICPADARATDLAGGWLLDCRLHQQMRVRGNGLTGDGVRKSEVLGIATGWVTTKAAYENSADPLDRLNGLVIGGGRVQQDRDLALVIRKPYVHVKIASAIATAISDRFFFFDGSTRRGIATAISENKIDLKIPPRYDRSLERLVAVINEIPISPKTAQSQSRLSKLGTDLRKPSTASRAALALEATGESAVPTLLSELENENREIRFYVAESLAYLDRYESVTPLVKLIREVPAFRHPALHALRDLDHSSVAGEVAKLLDDDSTETRYGAFAVLRDRNQLPSSVQVRKLSGFELASYQSPQDSPIVVGSIRDVSEIVVFGKPAAIKISTFLRDRHGVVAKPIGKDRISIDRFTVGGEDRHTEVDNNVIDFIEGLSRVGSPYQDILAMLQTAKEDGALEATIAIDPLPHSNRIYHRDSEPE